ncbi:MAG: RelA/SpoT family protein [Candidatus Aminicenantia bacterium]
MIRFEDIIRKVIEYKPEADLDLLRKAFVFAGKAHKGQTRRTGEPYLQHLLEVTNILASLRLDEVSLTGGLLHDVLEDTDVKYDELKSLFGKEIADVVESLTKISAIHLADEERQGENIRRIFQAMMDDVRVILIKLADRLHNMRTLYIFSEEDQKRIARETLDIYAPLTDRLGMGEIKEELENLSFRYLEPETYFRLASIMEERRPEAESRLKKMKGKIEKLLAEHGIEAEVQYRVKKLYSIWKKMKKQGVDFDHVFDILGIRIITNSIDDCYAIQGWISQRWRTIPTRYKDFIAMPKQNKYQSIHLTIISEEGIHYEIQIRTKEMHWIAEHGFAAHWIYKEETKDIQKELKESFTDFLEFQMNNKSPAKFFESLRKDLKMPMIYPLTPKGKVIPLPEGSTPVDFAFQIHTDIGYKCKGAKVNGRPVPIRYQLKTWDVVEIETSQEQAPSRDWLNFVKTERARRKIKEWFAKIEKQRSIEEGKRLWTKFIKKFSSELKNFSDKESLEERIKRLNFQSIDDFYSSIGFGRTFLNISLLEKLFPEVKFQEKSFFKKFFEIVSRKEELGIKIDGYDDILLKIAKCCNPIKGEKIVGYITRGKGISIHSVNCSNIVNEVLEKERLLKAEWQDGAEITYPAKIRVLCKDIPGIFAKVANAVSDTQTNIRKALAETFPDGNAKIDLTIDVRDISHLDKILKSIKDIKGVISVSRI